MRSKWPSSSTCTTASPTRSIGTCPPGPAATISARPDGSSRVDMRKPRIAAALAVLLLVGSREVRAQSGGAATSGPPRTHRWLDWQAGALDARYRIIENSAGRTTTNQLQARETARLGLLFDRHRRYSLQVFFGTGNNFTGSWDPLGPGTGTRAWDLHVRQLYFSAAPVRGLTLELGGFGLVRGEETEATSWDNDGFMTGARARLRPPPRWYLDEVAL